MIDSVVESDSLEIQQIMIAVRDQSPWPLGPIWSVAQTAEECRHQGFVSRGARGEIRAFILFREAVAAWEISFLATAPNAMGQGFMRALLEHMIRVRPSGKPLWLEVHEGNLPALRLYDSVGFKEVGRRPRYYSDGGACVLYNYG